MAQTEIREVRQYDVLMSGAWIRIRTEMTPRELIEQKAPWWQVEQMLTPKEWNTVFLQVSRIDAVKEAASE